MRTATLHVVFPQHKETCICSCDNSVVFLLHPFPQDLREDPADLQLCFRVCRFDCGGATQDAVSYGRLEADLVV
jgi:hypothetical protein